MPRGLKVLLMAMAWHLVGFTMGALMASRNVYWLLFFLPSLALSHLMGKNCALLDRGVR